MPLLTIQVDPTMVEDATNIGIGMKQAGHAFNGATPPQIPEHVMHSAILIGLKVMKEKWPVRYDSNGDPIMVSSIVEVARDERQRGS